jgi:thiol-disulfide isomerase/thioredoxin
MLADLYNEKYLVADSYRGWLMGTYPEYLRTLAIRKNPAHKNINYDTDIFQQIANNYKGKIRELKLYDKINKTIFYCRSFEELNLYKEMLPAYIALLHDKKDVEALTAALANMETTLMSAQIGQPAPVFTIADSTGVEYSLEQYKGKVIYLDLWASWCGPCRAEAVPFKKLVEKYKDNENVAFISIAVIDKVDKWKEALIADKPTWLQLFDKNDVVKKAYFANSIPKFILIDKKGNIVSFDAPMPSSGDEIEKLINRQLVN